MPVGSVSVPVSLIPFLILVTVYNHRHLNRDNNSPRESHSHRATKWREGSRQFSTSPWRPLRDSVHAAMLNQWCMDAVTIVSATFSPLRGSMAGTLSGAIIITIQVPVDDGHAIGIELILRMAVTCIPAMQYPFRFHHSNHFQ